MNEPWIHPGLLGSLIGGIFGTLGALIGTLAGVFIPKGKAKKLTLGVNTFAVVLVFIFFLFGIIAYFSGQARAVWLTSGGFGLYLTVSFSFGYYVIFKRSRDAELRKSMSEDLTFGDNKEEEKLSDEQ